MGEGALDHFLRAGASSRARYPISAARDWRRPLCAPPRRHANAGSSSRRPGPAMRVFHTPPSRAFNCSRRIADSPCRRPRRRVSSLRSALQPNRVEVARGLAPSVGESCRRIAFVGRMDRRGHDDAGVEVDRVLRLVGQMRRSVLHLGDPGVTVGRALPVGVRQRLALALPVESAPGPRRSACRCRSLRAIRVSIAR